jgi:hypothetical protein
MASDGGITRKLLLTKCPLLALENGALFVDIPGMRELGMMVFGAAWRRANRILPLPSRLIRKACSIERRPYA